MWFNIFCKVLELKLFFCFFEFFFLIYDDVFLFWFKCVFILVKFLWFILVKMVCSRLFLFRWVWFIWCNVEILNYNFFFFKLEYIFVLVGVDGVFWLVWN